MYKTVAFIPVRGGSKSIPGKNIKHLAGKPLVYWGAKAASGCELIDRVYVATDDPLIAATVDALSISKVKVIGRSPATATDTASTESALLEFAHNVTSERIVLIQATSPLLTSQDLRGGLEMFDAVDCDSLLSTVPQKRFIWNEGSSGLVTAANYDPLSRPRRQDFTGYLVENGAFYVMRRAGLLASGSRLHGKVATWKMDPSTFVEIDEPDDWLLIERELLRQGKAKDAQLRERLRKIKLVLTDVDGVLTDAGMYYSETGDEIKKFNTRDGKAFEILRNMGIKGGIITSENTRLVEWRARKLKLDYLFQGAVEKASVLDEIIKKHGFSLDEIAYVGDDLADVPILEKTGVSACPMDAVRDVQAVAGVRIPVLGGAGVIRYLVDLIVDAKK